ncbi:cupin domain-containing protein [Polyangium jinanense]|uniref:cupin domain-containing protein n=1 Tax=Polyangium jinanense TaxID=2829994 RepID=UPI002341199E|nr:cupin domain-containing protein [Polyangium jinanense]MDC3962124.1 cupin domain-containing protein [Polyangium jinanense]
MSDKATELRQRLIRNFNTANLEHFQRAPLYDTASAGLAQGTAAKKLGASIDIMPPGARSCPYHYHYVQEEMFIILEGEGTLRVAGEHLPISAGDVIFIPPGPEYPHHILNTSNAPLKYMSISTMEFPEICEYPDSGKYLAKAEAKPGAFRVVQRKETSLDYWDGEP